MVSPVATTLIVAALLAAGWSSVLVVLNRTPGYALLGALGAVEAGLLVQAIVGIVSLIGTDRPVDSATFVGYLIGSLLILPAGVAWSLGERSRWGPGVMAIACLAIPVVIVRLQQIWGGLGA
ncbi:MAG: hypothetical protein ACRDRA_16695 [Pseudonocardiaceae bacterium]